MGIDSRALIKFVLFDFFFRGSHFHPPRSFSRSLNHSAFSSPIILMRFLRVSSMLCCEREGNVGADF